MNEFNVQIQVCVCEERAVKGPLVCPSEKCACVSGERFFFLGRRGEGVCAGSGSGSGWM